MKKMRRVWVLVLALVMSSLVLTACGSSAKADFDSPEAALNEYINGGKLEGKTVKIKVNTDGQINALYYSKVKDQGEVYVLFSEEYADTNVK